MEVARRGDLKAALLLSQKAWQSARERKDDHALLVATQAASIVHMIRGDSISAVAAAIDAYQMAQRLGHRSLMGHARVNLCYAGVELGALEDAEADMEACVAQAMDDADPGLEIRARVALAVLLGYLGKFGPAPQHLRRAMDLARSHPGFTPPGCIAANLANIYRKWGAAQLEAGRAGNGQVILNEAVRLAAQAFRLAVDEGGLSAAIDALGTRACALDLLGEREKAAALLAYAATFGDTGGSRTSALWVLCDLGRIRLVSADFDGARSAFIQAVDIASGLRPCACIHLACTGLAQAEAALGREGAAEQWRARAATEEAEFERWRRDARGQLERFLGRIE